ncbi:PIN domain-containing protein [Bacillus paranthracis]|uniref:PIN domain-containing protein n=1 Tax=Bacillus paranthracis TaxID=2026186 RepID=A0AAX3QG19_9BACI|nr:PIN domain-containing protein [Bacillus paranthracis]KMP14880.1 hypothetical protein TU49_27460 [Bacillus cereus]WES07746.1 PIN domain-containing protein [Bacillus paranthracis]
MKYLSLDTNIYLDMVVSRNKSHTPDAYEQMKKLLDYGEIKLVVPSIVIREVDRHINNEIEKINAHLKLIKKNVDSLYWINNVEEMKLFKQKIPNVKKDIKDIQKLFENNKGKYLLNAKEIFDNLFSHNHVIILEETHEILFRAQVRQLYKKRPFHYNQQEKDSLADAVIIESLIEFTNTNIDSDDHLYFISRNTKDFSADDAEDKLHPEINESIVSANIERQFKYRNFFNKTLRDDFKDEAEHAGFLEELEVIRNSEYAEYLVEQHRDSASLPSLSSDWEVIISEYKEAESFLGELLDYQGSLINQFENLSDEYFDLIDQIQHSNLESTQQLIRNFNDNDIENLEISEDLDENQAAIIELIDSRISIDINGYEATDLWNCEDYFSLNDGALLKFQDFNNKVLKVEISGDLCPEDGGADFIDVIVNDNILNKSIKGVIEVRYGYMNFDEDNCAADGMKEEVHFYLDDVIEAVKNVSHHLEKQIQHERIIIEEIRVKLGL